MKSPVTFYSEGYKLVGDIYSPPDLQAGQKRAGIVLCHGYTGVKDLYLPDNAKALTQAGYMAMTFDCKGWGNSEGPSNRLAPFSRVQSYLSAPTMIGWARRKDPNISTDVLANPRSPLF